MKLHIKIPALEYQSAITSDIALPTKMRLSQSNKGQLLFF